MINTIQFPGLGLEFTLNRVAFEVFGHPIYWYAVIIVLGFAMAWLYCSHKAPAFGIQSDDVTDLLLYAVPLCIIGARLYYILFYLDLYRTQDGGLDFGKMLRIWDGGLAIYGGIIMGIIVLFFLCRQKKIPFLAFADLGSMGLLIGQCIGRWGNFMNVEAYGGVTDLPWRMSGEKIAGELFQKGLVDAEGWQAVVDGTLGVHPTFFYESAWNLLGFLLLVLLAKRWRQFDGQLFFTYLAWYGIGRGIIEGLRTDSLYVLHTGIRVSQALGFASAAAGIAVLAYVLLVKKPSREALWVSRSAEREVPLGKEQPKTEGPSQPEGEEKTEDEEN